VKQVVEERRARVGRELVEHVRRGVGERTAEAEHFLFLALRVEHDVVRRACGAATP